MRAEKAYTRRMTEEGRIFKERQQEQVLCPECGKELAKGSLVVHHQNQNGVAKGGGRGRRAMRKAGATSLELSGCCFLKNQDQGLAQLKGVVAGKKHGRQCVYTSSTSTSGTLW